MNKLDLITLSLESELKLLDHIKKDPEKFINNDIIFNALKDQSSFSKYFDPDLRIISYSLNTHKTYANKFHILGYKSINNLRIEAYELLKSLKTNTYITKVNDPQKQINALMQRNLLLTNLIVYLNQNLSSFANKSNSLILLNEYKEINRYIQDSLTFIDSVEVK